MDENDVLEEWITGFLRHKDILTRKILEITRNNDSLVVKEKDGERKVLLRPSLDSFKDLDEAQKTVVVTFNTEHNLKALVTAWESVKDNANLTIYFINPISELEKRWIIMPRTHSLVSDDSALEQGLKAMFDTVEPVTDEVMKRMIG